MQHESRHIILLTEIMLMVIHLEFEVFERRGENFILTTQDYEKIQQIKQLITELEELDFTS